MDEKLHRLKNKLALFDERYIKENEFAFYTKDNLEYYHVYKLLSNGKLDNNTKKIKLDSVSIYRWFIVGFSMEDKYKPYVFCKYKDNNILDGYKVDYFETDEFNERFNYEVVCTYCNNRVLLINKYGKTVRFELNELEFGAVLGIRMEPDRRNYGLVLFREPLKKHADSWVVTLAIFDSQFKNIEITDIGRRILLERIED